MAQLLPSPFPCCLKMPLLVVRQLTAIKCKQACCKMISFTWQTRKSKLFSFSPFAHKNGGYVKASFHSKTSSLSLSFAPYLRIWEVTLLRDLKPSCVHANRIPNSQSQEIVWGGGEGSQQKMSPVQSQFSANLPIWEGWEGKLGHIWVPFGQNS